MRGVKETSIYKERVVKETSICKKRRIKETCIYQERPIKRICTCMRRGEGPIKEISYRWKGTYKRDLHVSRGKGPVVQIHSDKHVQICFMGLS